MTAGVLSAMAILAVAAALTMGTAASGFWSRRLRQVAGLTHGDSNPLDARIGARVQKGVASRLPGFLRQIEHDAAWVALDDPDHPFADPRRVLGLCVIGALLGQGLFFAAFAEMLLSAFGVVAGIFAVRVFQRSRANNTRRRFRRELPEVAQVLAMEVAAGAGLLQGLERAASTRMVTATWIRRALGAAQQSGRSVFEELLDSARALGLQEAISFAVQIELVHRKGTGGAELLAEVAERAAADYIAEVSRAIDGLEPAMAAPTVLFFFVPFFVVILGLTLLALIGSGIFGG